MLTLAQAAELIEERRKKLEEERESSEGRARERQAWERAVEAEREGLKKEKLRREFEAALWCAHAELSKEIRAIWWSMQSRCKHDPYYQGRISVCERWLRLDSFWADMGDRPSRGHSLGRIDNERGYEPGNCRWELAFQQAGNKRTLRKTISGVRGVSWDKTRGAWVASGMYRGIMQKLYKGPDFEQAVLCRKAWEKAVHERSR